MTNRRDGRGSGVSSLGGDMVGNHSTGVRSFESVSVPFVRSLPPVRLPERYNYIGVFLTFACNYRCPQCINRFGVFRDTVEPMTGAEWIRGLNRLRSRPDLPVTLQGGEPTLHPDFYDIVRSLRPDLGVDLLTNLQFDVHEFMCRIPPERMRREAPYASIRVSYHPWVMDFEELSTKVRQMLARGYSVGVWAIEHPAWQRQIEEARVRSMAEGIDFRVKEFLGFCQGQLIGTYRWPEAVSGKKVGRVQCRTSEFLIGPDGRVFRCHRDLYAGEGEVGHICDPAFDIADVFRDCENYGLCNPCDVKIKTNRFQQFGHTSVEIRFSR
ncbi:MAG: radical SAM protein [Kiritimatiellae bacterium]|nr:radical SAM protein [Kiritimatiellia bacterium]